MAKSALSAKFFHDEAAAFAKLESILWPQGPVCPRCGGMDRITPVRGKTARMGLRRCGHCKRQFTVTVGTVFESSHVPLNLWLQASHLLCSSKKGMSSHQIHRILGVQYKTAWFMTHRLREAMRDGVLAPMGGEGKTVEADETYIGRKDAPRTNKRGGAHKNKVMSLVERRGKVRSVHVDQVTSQVAKELLTTHADTKSALMTDEATWYIKAGKEFASHESVAHRAEEYVRGNVHTNTVEGFYSIFKRGMKGVYQHCSEKHLHRYLAEFDFRYNHRVALGVNDFERTISALSGVVGKRLTYQTAGV